jgi:F420 biosynthesis protein FbiB-like protein
MNSDFWKVLCERRSIRRYLDQTVPSSLLKKIIDAAAHAPSAHNNQPWHFVVVTSPDIRSRLVRSMADRYDQDMTARNVPDHTRNKRITRSLELLGKAPVLIFAYAVHEHRHRGDAEYDEEMEEVLNRQSVAAAVGHLLAAAAASGLGACWYAAPLFCPDIVNDQLRVHTEWEPQALITMGYPDEAAPPKDRKPLSDVVTYV